MALNQVPSTMPAAELDEFLSASLPEAAADFPGLQLLPHTDSPTRSCSEGSESMGVPQPMAHGHGGGSGARRSLDGSHGSGTTSARQNTSAGMATTACSGDTGPSGGTGSGGGGPSYRPTAADSLTEEAAALQHGTTSPTFTAAPTTAAMSAAAPGMSMATPALGATTQAPAVPLAGVQGLLAVGSYPGWHMQQQLLLLPTGSAGVNAPPAAGYGHTTPGARPPLHRAGSSDVAGPSRPSAAHSNVEKLRRDRLNDLIDRLSDIVPPADPKYGADAGGASTGAVRRPKHVVLADTLAMLRSMQERLALEEAEIMSLKAQAAAAAELTAAHAGDSRLAACAAATPLTTTAVPAAPVSPQLACQGPPLQAVAPESAQPDGVMPTEPQPELPAPPAYCPPSTGVIVEEAPGCLLVKVSCRDRKGLLSDVVATLKALPVAISTAAVTTTRDGCVHDVFEVRASLAAGCSCAAPTAQQVCQCLEAAADCACPSVPSAAPLCTVAQVVVEDPDVTPEDVQCAVHTALFAGERTHGKRVRALV